MTRSRTATLGDGQVVWPGCIVTFFAPLPEDEGIWRVTDITRRGSRGMVIHLENESGIRTAAYSCHLEKC